MVNQLKVLREKWDALGDRVQVKVIVVAVVVVITIIALVLQ